MTNKTFIRKELAEDQAALDLIENFLSAHEPGCGASEKWRRGLEDLLCEAIVIGMAEGAIGMKHQTFRRGFTRRVIKQRPNC